MLRILVRLVIFKKIKEVQTLCFPNSLDNRKAKNKTKQK